MLLTILLLAFQEPAAPVEPAPSELRVKDLKAHIGFLASDELEGRESGKRGGHLAADYVENQFRRFGLEAITEDGSYRIPFEVNGLTCYNVVGIVRGTDPEMRESFLAVGGHHDHAGIGGPGAMGFPGEIHNGADDNASGTSGVLELAQWYAANPAKHSIIFMTFDAEERGLIGSRVLAEGDVLPKDRIMAMINLDMIGRVTDDFLFVGGLGTASELRKVLDPVFAASDLELELDDRGEAPSDNTSFFNVGIPSLFFFSHVHEDYHMPGDDANKINYEGQLRVLQLVRTVLDRLDQEKELTFRDFGGMGMPSDFNERMNEHYRKIMERRNNKGRLGVRAGEEEGASGLRVESVRAGSAAEEAGVEAGDLLVEVNGRPTPTLNDLRRALGGGMKGDEVTVAVERRGERIEVKAKLH